MTVAKKLLICPVWTLRDMLWSHDIPTVVVLETWMVRELLAKMTSHQNLCFLRTTWL